MYELQTITISLEKVDTDRALRYDVKVRRSEFDYAGAEDSEDDIVVVGDVEYGIDGRWLARVRLVQPDVVREKKFLVSRHAAALWAASTWAVADSSLAKHRIEGEGKDA